MSKIHILRGRGNNCTCMDCITLYGGKCDTSADNNFLDSIEEKVIEYLSFTPKGKVRKTSDYFMDSCINNIIRPAVRKYAKIHVNQFDRKYYLFMPMIYLMTSDRKSAEHWYRRARNWVYNDVIKQMQDASKDKIEYE